MNTSTKTKSSNNKSTGKSGFAKVTNKSNPTAKKLKANRLHTKKARRNLWEKFVLGMLDGLNAGQMKFVVQCDGRNEEYFFGEKNFKSSISIAAGTTRKNSGYVQKTRKKEIIHSNEVYCEMNITDKRFFKNLVYFGDIGFGEAYVDGYWNTPNIEKVVSWFLLNLRNVPTISGTKNKTFFFNIFKMFNLFLQHKRRSHSQNVKKNISEHYDLSNSFFKIFLDETMTYSAAHFAPLVQEISKGQKKLKKNINSAKVSHQISAVESTNSKPLLFNQPEEMHLYKVVSKIIGKKPSQLAIAQCAKYDRLCKMLKLREGHEILEIGSGWGGFAFYASTAYGVKVRSITLSEKQFQYAEALRKKNGIGKNVVQFEIIDYRKVRGKFDRLVSIEMIEAVGWQFLDEYFSAFQRLLKPKGMFGLQAIVCPDGRFQQMKKNVDWLQKHIFPGSCIPSVKAIADSICKNGDFFLYDVKDFGQDYAQTLALWYNRFNGKIELIKSMGYSERFIRKWNYYLKYCEAAFSTRNISVMQLVYARPNNVVQ